MITYYVVLVKAVYCNLQPKELEMDPKLTVIIEFIKYVAKLAEKHRNVNLFKSKIEILDKLQRKYVYAPFIKGIFSQLSARIQNILIFTDSEELLKFISCLNTIAIKHPYISTQTNLRIAG